MAKVPTKPAPTRKSLSRARREARMQRIVTLSTIVVAVVVVGLLLFAFINEQFIKPARVLLSVYDEDITVADFQDNVKFGYYLRYGSIPPDQLAQFGVQFDEATFAQDILLAMVDDRILAKKAAEAGIEISDAEVQERIELGFGYDAGEPEPTPTATAIPSPTLAPTATATFVFTPTPFPTATPVPGVTPTAAPPTPTPSGPPTPTPTLEPQPTPTPLDAAGFEQLFDQQITEVANGTGLTKARVRELWIQGTRSIMITERLYEEFEPNIPETQVKTHVAHILIRAEYASDAADEEIEAAYEAARAEAEEALARIRGGEDFAVVAAEVSDDTSNAYKGGDLGWSTAGQFVDAFDAVAQTLPVGEVSEPVRTEFGWHIIKVYDRQTVPLSEGEREFEKQSQFSEQISAWREEAAVDLGVEWLNYIPDLP